MRTVKIETIERYTSLWNKLQALDLTLKRLESMSFMEFNIKINSKGKTNGQYKLALSLYRNQIRSEQVNSYLLSKNIPKSIIKPIPKTILKPITQVKPTKILKKPFKSKTIVKKDSYYSHLTYKGLALNKIAKLKNVWNISKAKTMKHTFQEISLNIKFNIYQIINNRMVLVNENIWLTFSSNNSSQLTLVKLSELALLKWYDYVAKLTQSKLIVKVLKIFTNIYRHGN